MPNRSSEGEILDLTDAKPEAEANGSGVGAAAASLGLLASLNHEIRTPLSGILGMTDLLLETKLSGEQREYVAAARDCAESLFDLLNATLEYTSLQTGCVEVETAEFHPWELVDGLMAEAASRARARGIELRVRRGEGLNRPLVGDAYRLRQLLNQLFQFSIRYGAGSLIEADIRLDGANGLPELAVTLEDGGASIRPNGTLSSADVGMAVMRGLLDLLEGRMEITEAEMGSRASRRLAIRVPVRYSRHHRAGEDAAKHEERASVPPTILVVDDNRISQQVIGALLAKGGWRYETALDGLQALEATAQRRYQLILMDLQMPGMDGLEATIQIRKQAGYKKTPILALTADVSDAVRARCREAGMDAFLEKPIHTVELQSMLGQFLHSPEGD